MDWYTKTFAAAIHTKEYQTWCYDNVVFTEDSELTPAGLHKQMDSLRTTFLPILQTIDLLLIKEHKSQLFFVFLFNRNI